MKCQSCDSEDTHGEWQMAFVGANEYKPSLEVYCDNCENVDEYEPNGNWTLK